MKPVRAMLLTLGGMTGGLLLSGQGAPGSAPAHRAAPATGVNERKPSHLSLIVDPDNRYEADFPASPIVLGDRVNLLAGETVLVEAEVEKDRLVRLRVVDRVVHPERTLRLHLYQRPDSADTLFTIGSPFKRHLRYRSKIMPAGRTEYEETSNVGVERAKLSFEAWPFAIVRIELSEFQLAGPPGKARAKSQATNP